MVQTAFMISFDVAERVGKFVVLILKKECVGMFEDGCKECIFRNADKCRLEIDRMSIIEQVKELREHGQIHKHNSRYTVDLLNKAADTIESLSAKLQAADMERSADNCGGWIPCSERLPGNKDDVLVCWGGNNISVGYYVSGGAGGWFFNYGFDYKGDRKIPCEPFAWQSLPEPYHEP